MAGYSAQKVVCRIFGVTTPDSDLLTLYREYRDESAFSELIRRHIPMVRIAAARVLHNQADVEDATQAVFLVLIQRVGGLDGRNGIGPWLYGVAHRIAVRLRNRNRRTIVQLNSKDPACFDMPSDLSLREACDTLHVELDRLPDRYRLPLLLCYIEGQTREAAASALGLSVGSVKGRVRRGLALLRRRLVKRGVSLSAGLLSAATALETVSAVSPALTLSFIREPSSRAAELAKETLMRTMMWKWVAGVALLVIGSSAVIAAVLAATDRSENALPIQYASVEPIRVSAAPRDPPRPAVLHSELLFSSREDSALQTLAFGPGGKVLVTGGSRLSPKDNGTVRLRDPATGKPTATFPLPLEVLAIAISPDGKQLSVGTSGILQGPRAKPYNVAPGRLAILSFPDGKVLFNLKGGSNSYPAIAYRPDGKLLAVGGSPADEKGLPRDVTPVTLWDATTGKEMLKLKGQPGYIRGVAFSPDGKTLAVASMGQDRPGQPWLGYAHLWDVERGKDLIELKVEEEVWSVAFSPDGKLVATGGGNGNIRLWDPATGKELAKLKSGAPAICALVFSPDGRMLAAGGGDPGNGEATGALKVWDVETWKELAELKGHEGTVRGLAFSPDGARLAVGDQHGTLKVWSLGRQ
jgi:RNA polymerase sigma factor (sigma-70 family)